MRKMLYVTALVGASVAMTGSATAGNFNPALEDPVVVPYGADGPVTVRCKHWLVHPDLIYWYTDGPCKKSRTVVIDSDGDGVLDTPVSPGDPDYPDNPDPKDPDPKDPDPKDPDPKDPPKDRGPKGNNGWGNGNQDSPGNSGPNNNAENHGGGQTDGTANGDSNSGKGSAAHGGKGKGKGNDKGGNRGKSGSAPGHNK